MPRETTSGQANVVVHIVADHTFAPSETIAMIAGPGNPATGITVTLPGVTSTPDLLPNDGDSYTVADAGGFSLGCAGVFVDPGGALIFGSTAPLGPLLVAGFSITFTYDPLGAGPGGPGAWSLSFV
jgi:hypothetical protein